MFKAAYARILSTLHIIIAVPLDLSIIDRSKPIPYLGKNVYVLMMNIVV